MFLPGESQGRGASWAAVSGVAQSQTRLKRLSSSSMLISILFQILFPIKFIYRILCFASSRCIVRLSSVSILYIVAYICYSQISNPLLSQPPVPWRTQVCSLCPWIWFVNNVFNLYVRFHLQVISCHLFFSSWLASVSMIISRCIHVSENDVISFFYDWITVYWIYATLLSYPVYLEAKVFFCFLSFFCFSLQKFKSHTSV